MQPRLLISGLLLLAGCADTPTTTDSPGTQPVPEPDAPSVTIKVQTPEETARLVVGHKGRIVVLDLWTLW